MHLFICFFVTDFVHKKINIKVFVIIPPFNYFPAFVFMCLLYKSFGNTVRKGDCSSQAISPFPIKFYILVEKFQPFSPNLKLLLVSSFSLKESKICHLAKVYLFFTLKPDAQVTPVHRVPLA